MTIRTNKNLCKRNINLIKINLLNGCANITGGGISR